MLNRRLPNIIVPKDDDSLMALYENNDVEGDYIIFPIGRDDLDAIFKSGFFNKINEQVGVIIAPNEEADITEPPEIGNLLSILTEFKTNQEDPLLKYYFDCFDTLFNKAVELSTGVFFYF